MKKRFTDEQIIGFLREADAGLPIKELCRKHCFSEASYYLWRSKFGGMSVPDAKRLKELETENTRLNKLLAEQMLENEVLRDVLRKKRRRTGPASVGAPDDRQETEQTVFVARRGHERQRLPLSDAARPQRGAAAANRGAGAATQALWRRGDPPET